MIVPLGPPLCFLGGPRLAGAFFAAGFFAGAFAAGFLAAVPLAPLAPFSSSFCSLPGQSKLGHSFHGPRAVVTITIGAPQCSHTSSVAVSAPYWGSG